MIIETSAVNFRQNLGEMLNHVQYRRDSIVINKNGKSVAVLIDAQLFERVRRMQGRFDAIARRIEKSFAGIAEQDGLAEIDAAIQAERGQARATAALKPPPAAPAAAPAPPSLPPSAHAAHPPP